MIKNLLRVALRNFKRDTGYSLLNILGLTIGITFSLFLIFYIQDELSFDRYHEKAGRIYRINSYAKEPDKDEMKWAFDQFPLAPALKKDYPEVEEAIRFVNAGKTIYKNGDLRFYEEKIFFTDSSVFNVFTYPFIEGDSKTALIAPHSMVLTQSLAEKYFGKHRRVVGKSLENGNGEVFKITGVVKDVPKNSHLIFNALLSVTTLPKDFSDNWGGFNFLTYVLLKPNTNAAQFEKKLLPMYDKYMASIFAQYNIKIHYGVQPITAIHLHSDLQGEPEEVGSMSYIYIFSAVALFMIIIACINYMNLTTARSARRAKEIGIRKVTGSSQKQLVAQFLAESILTALFALLLSIGFIALFLSTFNALAGKFIAFSTLFQPGTILILVAIVLLVGLLGGSYPAFYLSTFNPVHVLKGNLSKGSGNVTLRRILVVVQFTISMIMLICTWVVYGQLQYLRNKDVGFNRDYVLTLTANTNKDIKSSITAFKNDMQNMRGILSVSTAESTPGKGNNFQLFTIETNKGHEDKGVDVYGIDENYTRTLGIQTTRGRNFSGITDTLHSIIVNESMVKAFGWNEPLGKRVTFPGDTSGTYFEVVGVVKNFNQKSLYNPIAPLILYYSPNSNNIQLKLEGKNLSATIAGIEKIWKRAFPDLPYQYTFLDQDFRLTICCRSEAWEDICHVFYSYNFHYLPGIAGVDCVYNTTAAKGNKHPQNNGCRYCPDCTTDNHQFRSAGRYLLPGSIPGGLLVYV